MHAGVLPLLCTDEDSLVPAPFRVLHAFHAFQLDACSPLQLKGDIRLTRTRTYATGVGLRFPIATRVRWDKAPWRADTDASLAALTAAATSPGAPMAVLERYFTAKIGFHIARGTGLAFAGWLQDSCKKGQIAT